MRLTQGRYICGFRLAFSVQDELSHAAPVMVEGHWQHVIQTTGESKRRREELEQCRIVSAQQGIECPLAISRRAIRRSGVGAVERNLPATLQQRKRKRSEERRVGKERRR